ncbi:uncharacterized protein [Amphiura filiformis]|uniref:uncharacterized protein n=1 Tax=Amphiura filiformis TaxID=82378 RepID=UPI003B21BF76
MANITLKVTLECSKWNESGTCLEYLAGNIVVGSIVTPVVIAILVIVGISLFLAMGSVVASCYLIRQMRQGKEQKADDCHCSHRKVKPEQYDMGTTQQLPLPGLANRTQMDFAESRNRSASSPNIVLPLKKSPQETRVDYENVIGRESPKKPRRSNSLPQRRLVKKWPGIRFTNKSGQQDQTPTETKNNKSRILKGSATPSNLLQNMHDITYELTGKGDFQPPPKDKKCNNYESDERRLVISSGEEPTSPDDDDAQPSKASGTNGNPVYYTLEATINDDDDSSDANASKPGISKHSGKGVVSLSVPGSHGLDELPILSRSMSDAFEKKKKKPSFKIVSTTSKLNKDSKRQVVNSSTWNARELVKNKIMLQQQRELSAKSERRRSSELYEDIVNDCADGVAPQPKDSEVKAAEIPGSYSLLSRSLEEGLAGGGGKLQLPGYQQLSVGGSEYQSGPENNATGMMV